MILWHVTWFIIVTLETRFEIIETDLLPVISFGGQTRNMSLTCKFDPASEPQFFQHFDLSQFTLVEVKKKRHTAVGK